MDGLFRQRKAMIGMIHVQALPGSPGSNAPVYMAAQQAAAEAKLLESVGFDGLMIENMHDRPYLHGAKGPEVVAAMTRIALEVRAATELPLGIQILSGGNKEALAVAQSSGADFIRCENFVFAHVADEGILAEAEAGDLLRYRRVIDADEIKIFCDIKKKHASHAITADITIGEAAEAAEFFGADGLIVTGQATGKPTDVEDVAKVRSSSKLPVLVGSGVTPESVEKLFEHADALIVGSWFKRDGNWANNPDPDRAERLIAAANLAR
jgi:membrane complex biogenesis BtpA family protein